MGSLGEPHDKGIDPTVGGLVWVRRRNGSWWPGQIIDSGEISESFMISSPKSGTPIKLLGRDDIIVDWYNLEKSKRVKPFRCGEYDYCIEKAKHAAANPARKVVKYARREDAIICALKIERENSKDDPVESSPTVSLSSKGTERTDDDFSGFKGNDSLVHDGIEEPNQGRPRWTPSDSEDEVVKQPRRRPPRTPNASKDEVFKRPRERSPRTPNASKDEVFKRPRGRSPRTPNDSEDEVFKQPRGRPPRTLNDSEDELLKRPRGRPRRTLNDSEVEILKRPRGRPRQTLTDSEDEILKRPRGRPRQTLTDSEDEIPKRPRGRPRQTLTDSEDEILKQPRGRPRQTLTDSEDEILKRPRGRPRRNPNDSEDEGAKRMKGLADLGMGVVPAMKRKRTVHEFVKRKHRHLPLSKVLESAAVVANEPKRSSSVVINKNSDSIGVPCGNRILRSAFRRVSESNPVSSASAIPEKASSGKLFDPQLVAKRAQPSDTLENASQNRRVSARRLASQNTRAKTVQLGKEELYKSISTSSGAADFEEIEMWRLKGKRRNRKPILKKMTNFDDDLEDGLDWYWGCKRPPKAAPQTSFPHRQWRSAANPKYSPELLTINEEDVNSDLYEVNLQVKAASYAGQRVPFTSLTSKSTGQAVVGHSVTVEALEEESTADMAREWNVPEDEQKIGLKHLKSHRVSPIKVTKLGKSATSPKKIRKLSSLLELGKLSRPARALVAEEILSTVVACIPLEVVYSRLKEYLRIRGLMLASRRSSKRVVKPKRW